MNHHGGYGYKQEVTPLVYDERMMPTVPLADSSHNDPVRRVQTRAPWYNPQHWRRRTWAIILGVVVIIIIIIVAVAVTESKKKGGYPDYTALKYTIQDTCMSSARLGGRFQVFY